MAETAINNNAENTTPLETSLPKPVEAASKSKPKWNKWYSLASAVIVCGVFASTLAGGFGGSTLIRPDEASLSVEQLIAVEDVSYLLTETGELYSQGLNNYGQLGINSLDSSKEWKKVSFSTDAEESPVIKKIASRGEHVVALDSTGGLWTWGSSESGALGNGKMSPQLTPTKLSVSYSFSQLEVGKDFVVALDNNGAVYTWGQNSKGQLGNGSKDAVAGPNILSDLRFSSIKAGKDFVLALDGNGALWAWGNNSNGQYGNGNKDSSLTPIKVSDTRWSSIATSKFSDTVIAIDEYGALWSWGSGANALLGNGRDWREEQRVEDQRVKDLIASIQAEDAARKQGLIDKYTAEELEEARKIRDEAHVKWKEKIEKWDKENLAPKFEDFYTPPATAPDPEDEEAVAAETKKREKAEKDFAEASKKFEESKKAYRDSNPEPAEVNTIDAEAQARVTKKVEDEYKPTDTSGIRPTKIKEPEISNTSLVPVKVEIPPVEFVSASVGSENAYAIDVLGRIWAWGNDANGQTGLGINEKTHTHRPVRISEKEYSQVYGSDKWTLASDGEQLFVWGKNNNSNVLQSGSKELLTPTAIASGDFVSLDGNSFTGAVKTAENKTFTWGSNRNGEAGVDSEEQKTGIKEISSSLQMTRLTANAAVALDVNGYLNFWGSDQNLVSGFETPRTENTLVPTRHSIEKFIDIAAGRLSSQAVDANGIVWAWGLTYNSALGASGGAVIYPHRVPVGEKVKAISSNQLNTMTITESNKMRWWGVDSPNYAITTASTFEDFELDAPIESIESGKDHFVMLDKNGKAYSFATTWGVAQFAGQTPQKLFKVDLPGKATAVIAGSDSSIALIKGQAYGWGATDLGQVPLDGHIGSLLEPTELPAPYVGTWDNLSVGKNHGLGATSDGILYTWGYSKNLKDINIQPVERPIAVILPEGVK